MTLLFVFAAFTVALATVTVILHEGAVLVTGEALLFFGVVLGLLSIALIFLRAVGIPLLFLLSAVGVLGIYLAQPWEPVTGRIELLDITVLSAADGTMSLELRPYPPEPTGEELVRLPGSHLSATVELVRYHPYWFLLGRELGARALELNGFDAAGASDPVEDLALPEPCADGLCRFIRSRMSGLPGIEVETAATGSVPAAPLSTYSLVVEDSGAARLENR